MALNNSSNYNTLSDSVLTTNASPFNTAVGVTGLTANPSGLNNTAMGYQALNGLTTGGSCTAMGFTALEANTTGINNTAIGSAALAANTTGINNTAVGYQALFANTRGYSNIAVGSNALLSNITGVNNVAIGFDALNSNTTGTEQIGIGSSALSSQIQGLGNVAVGYVNLNALVTGSFNTGVGYGAISTIFSGSENVAIGSQALNSLQTGVENVVIGAQALQGLYNGSGAVAVGCRAAYAVNTSSVTAVGYQALMRNLGGVQSTAVGYEALYSSIATTGGTNTALGFQAGSGFTGSESNNILIGANVFGVPGDFAVTRIGATATMLKCFVGGIYGTVSTAGTASAPVVIDPLGQLGTIGPLTDGQLLIGSSGLNPVAATLTPGTGIMIANSPGQIILSAVGGGISWNSIVSSATASSNNGYIVNGNLTVGLPTASSLGDELKVILVSGTVSIGQAAGQSVIFGNTVTTTGTGGSLISTNPGDALSFVCTTQNLTWAVYASQGNWSVV